MQVSVKMEVYVYIVEGGDLEVCADLDTAKAFEPNQDGWSERRTHWEHTSGAKIYWRSLRGKLGG